MEPPDSLERKKAILEYWTLVEFFSPYILENTLDTKQCYQKIYANETTSQPLPWLGAEAIKEDDPATPFAKGYHLYLGLFSVEETADRARHVFAKQPSQWQSVNWKSCAKASSTTCFAKLTLTTHGVALFGTLSLSTLPWAHGRLLDGKQASLSIEEYWKSVNRLLVVLHEEFSEQLPIRLIKEPKIKVKYFDLPSLYKLVHLINEWAGYKPQGYPLVLIEPLIADATKPFKEPSIKSARDVPILNSFYIQDLEAAAISLATQKGMPIDLYLDDMQEKSNLQKRILLESQEGQKTILNTVRPEKTPSGRWPDCLSHQQNLMQQFAINAAFDSLKESGTFSVNGPPGTGKTSLLKEVIAENIVRRAFALSQLKCAQSAFVGKHALSFESSDPIFVSELDPSLLGYEMLIVSSNNTAVQNLSKEMPLLSKLGPTFSKASYIQPVAAKALGKDACILIAATLGNMENCRRFVEDVFTITSLEKGAARIWEWIDEYDGPSFVEARDAFIVLKHEQERVFEELEFLAFLHDELYCHTIETYVAHELKAYLEAIQETELLEVKLAQLLLEEAQDKELLSLLKEQERLWKKEQPNAFSRMMDRKLADAWNEKFSSIRKERLKAIEALHKSKTALKAFGLQVKENSNKESELTEQLLQKALLFYAYQESYDILKKAHPARLPNGIEELKDKEAHAQSYYLTQECNSVRSELFIAAMKLHESWLAEILRPKGGFRGNLMAISNVLQGKIPTTADDTRLTWQSLFLLIPVISSTFASFGRLFKHLEPGVFGWVLIDEAGQAVPQAAVGAIWRAKRVLSIGDPFQIEPICQVAGEVIDGMAKSKIKDYMLNWAPSQVSVQNLMDRISCFGSERTIRDESYWLGSPLRVHRRCQEPMFSIANSIAYESSMLLATCQKQEFALPKSCWWDVCGNTSDRQYVPVQGNSLAHLLKQAFLSMQNPDVYVISPFREVISQLQQLLLADKELHELFSNKYSNISLHDWLRQSTGTVHTFQGKQAAVVFFVLGADKSTLSAIDWASRKPNLLNVAVTRAQSRFYMIGDYDLWKTWPHFDVAARKLERCKF